MGLDILREAQAATVQVCERVRLALLPKAELCLSSLLRVLGQVEGPVLGQVSNAVDDVSEVAEEAKCLLERLNGGEWVEATVTNYPVEGRTVHIRVRFAPEKEQAS